MGQGEFAGVDADMAAEMLVSMAVGYIVQGLGDPSGADWGRQAQRSLEIIIKSWKR